MKLSTNKQVHPKTQKGAELVTWNSWPETQTLAN